MERLTLKAFVAQEGITSISNVRVNTNGYPFVTVLRGSGDDSAENVYFSKKASGLVDAGLAIKSIAKDLFVIETTNKAGDLRTKLSFGGDDYTDTSDLF